MTDLRRLAHTHIPRGAVTPGETFVPLDAPISEEVWTTAQPAADNAAEPEKGDEQCRR